MTTHPRSHWRARALFLTLLAASLACQSLRDFANIPDPEGEATDDVSIATAAPPTPTSIQTPTPTQTQTLPLSPMRPDFVSDEALLPNATRYTLEANFIITGTRAALLIGAESIIYTNTVGEPLSEMYLMLWPNDPHQYLAEMTLDSVRVNGEAHAFTLESDGLAARLDLPTPLLAGERLSLDTTFHIEIEASRDGGVRFGILEGVLLAPTFYPLIPRWVAGAWQTMPAPNGGDTTNSDTAFYTLRLTAPADLTLVSTGRVIASERNGATQTQTLITGPVRDVAVTLGAFETYQREVEGVMLNAYVLPDHAEYAADMLDYAEGQMRVLQQHVGPYPYTELDLVDAPGAFGGIEYPALVFIGVVDGSDFFREATVHEVGHQWFYGLIGDDQLLEPWLDESAASYTEVLYSEITDGPRAAQNMLDYYSDCLSAADDDTLPIGWPVDQYPTEYDYVAMVYCKGALFFAALRQRLGDEVFFTFLQTYYAQYRYGFATSADFQATAEATCACDLQDFFEVWVYQGGPR